MGRRRTRTKNLSPGMLSALASSGVYGDQAVVFSCVDDDDDGEKQLGTSRAASTP